MIVYIAINSVNGKKYIGATTRELRKRSEAHRHDAESGRAACRKFHRAIKKYGFSAFKWDILGKYSTSDDMFNAEIKFIKEMQPEYNISAGGKNPVFGLVRTAEWRANISKGNRGRNASPQALENMKKADRSKSHKKVTCLNDGIVHNSLKIAAKYYGIRPSTISSILCNREISIHGLHFRKFTSPLSNSECEDLIRADIEKKTKNKARAGKARRIPVICLNDMQVYESARDASRKLDIDVVGISACLLKKKISAGGYQFAYYTPDFSEADRNLITLENKQRLDFAISTRNAENRKQIICLNDLRIYSGYKAVAEAYNLGEVTVWKIITNWYKKPHKSGLRFSRIPDQVLNMMVA